MKKNFYFVEQLVFVTNLLLTCFSLDTLSRLGF
jgi:hypothetical protein